MHVPNSTLSINSLSQRDRYAITVLLTALLIAALIMLIPRHHPPSLQATMPPASAAAKVSLSKLPLYFIENQG